MSLLGLSLADWWKYTTIPGLMVTAVEGTIKNTEKYIEAKKKLDEAKKAVEVAPPAYKAQVEKAYKKELEPYIEYFQNPFSGMLAPGGKNEGGAMDWKMIGVLGGGVLLLALLLRR